jgi:hypothetical protein
MGGMKTRVTEPGDDPESIVGASLRACAAIDAPHAGQKRLTAGASA